MGLAQQPRRADFPLQWRCFTSSWILSSKKMAEKWVKNLENGKNVVNLQCK